MIFRVAKIEDLNQILLVRNSVTENTLSNPGSISIDDCIQFITVRGKGWVCEINNEIVGFSIVDLVNNNIWALFMKPAFEGKGIGKQLHDMMLDWYFEQTKINVWLGTSPSTRAELFYKKAGWIEIGKHGNDEVKFEMTYTNWKKSSAK